MKNQPIVTQDPAVFRSVEEKDIDLSTDQIDRHGTEFLRRFSDTAMLAADWFWEMDENLRFTYQSSRFEEITGLPTQSVIGKTPEEAFIGLIDDAEKWKRQGHVLREHSSYSMVWSLNRPDGQTRILRTRAKPVLDDAGKFLGYRGVGSDITDSKIGRASCRERV